MTLAGIGPVILVGAGKMGMALVRGWLAGGLDPSGLMLVDPAPADAVAAFAKQKGLALVSDVPDSAPQVLVLAVKPQVMGKVLKGLRGKIGAQTMVISIAAGVSLDTLSKELGTSRVVRTMPNTPAQVGKGITGAIAASGVDAAGRDVADALLRAAGQVVWLDDESQIDALTAVSGSGPAYVFLLTECMAAAGAAQGLAPEQAMALARQTVIGAAALMEADPTDVAQLRENVTSPGGTTAAALDVLLLEDGMRAMMARAIDAARRRSEELG